MTVPSETCFAALSWTGAETSFTPGFTAAAASDVKVYARNASGIDTLLTQGTHYSVTLDAAGAVTVTPVALPTAPQTLLILRDTPATQATDFQNLSSYSAATHTRLHDAAARRDGEDKFHRGRAVVAPLGETLAALPRAADRASKFAAFDADGNPVASASSISGVPATASSIANDSGVAGSSVKAALDTIDGALDTLDTAVDALDAIAASRAFDTAAALAAATVPASVSTIYLRGLSTSGVGGQRRRRSAAAPAHPCYSQSADGAYWVLDEPLPTFEMFGAPATEDAAHDCTPHLNDFMKYAAATGYRQLHFGGNKYYFLSRPNPVSIALTFVGAGVNSTYLLVGYDEDNVHGLFHQLRLTDSDFGLTITNLTSYSVRAVPTGGCAIYAASGNVTPIALAGTVTAGDVLTVTTTIDGTDYPASYTVLAGDTLRTIALALETAISNACNAHILFSSAVIDETIYLVLGDVNTVSIAVSTSAGSTETLTVGDVYYSVAGDIFWDKLRISGSPDNGWYIPIFLDGRGAALGAAHGVRQTKGTAFECFGGQVAAVKVLSAVDCELMGGLFQAGGDSGDLVIGGNADGQSEYVTFVGKVSGGVSIDQCADSIIINDSASSLTASSTVSNTTYIGAVATVTDNSAGGMRVIRPRGADTVQVFTSSGTFTAPTGLKGVDAVLIGGGGGGGSGRRGAAGSVRCGGGGGGGAAMTRSYIPAALIGSSVSVTVGAGGGGGAAVTADDTSGNAGTSGGSTSVGSLATAQPGALGSGGTAAAGTGGGAGVGLSNGGAGGAASTTGGAGNNGTGSAQSGGGGGAGGGVTSADAASNGGSGAAQCAAYGNRSTPTGGTANAGGTATAGTAVGANQALGGGGGAGGGAGTTGVGQAGGAGGNYGGGGGGGGASLNGNNSGAGGNGAPGIAVLICIME